MKSNDFITGFAQGNTEAFKRIYELYQKRLLFFVKQLVTDPEEAEDIVSETFLKLWHMKANFETENKIKAFLYISCKNSSINSLNYRKRIHSHHKNILHALSEEDFISHQEAYSEIMHQLEAAIGKLPLKQQDVIKMVLFEGLTDEEIAQRLNKTEKTVRNQKNTAIQLLRANIAKRALTLILLILILCLNSVNLWFKRTRNIQYPGHSPVNSDCSILKPASIRPGLIKIKLPLNQWLNNK